MVVRATRKPLTVNITKRAIVYMIAVSLDLLIFSNNFLIARCGLNAVNCKI